MRKAVMITVILVLAAGGAFAQFTVGGNLGGEYSLVQTDGDSNYNLLGFPFQAFGLYRIPQTIPIEGFGTATIDAGVTTGFINNIFGYEEFNTSMVPFLAMGRLKAEFLYVDIATGIYFPANAEDGAGIPFGGYSEVGYGYALSDELSLTAGGRFTFIGTSASNFNMLAVIVGAEYQL